MPKAKTTKTKKAPAEKKLESAPAVTKLIIPCRYAYAVSPLELASDYSNKDIKDKLADTALKAAIIGDFVAVQNSDCEETFIIHKDVLAELVKAVG